MMIWSNVAGFIIPGTSSVHLWNTSEQRTTAKEIFLVDEIGLGFGPTLFRIKLKVFEVEMKRNGAFSVMASPSKLTCKNFHKQETPFSPN